MLHSNIVYLHMLAYRLAHVLWITQRLFVALHWHLVGSRVSCEEALVLGVICRNANIQNHVL